VRRASRLTFFCDNCPVSIREVVPSGETWPQDLSVLVVDDDDLQRRFLAALLDQAGIGHLYWANNGRTALEMFRRGPQVDVVVCDLLMPEMDGQTFLTLLHGEGYTPSVVIASGADSETRRDMEETAVRLGLRVLGFVSKPVSLQALVTLLRKHPSVETAAPVVE
jgi:CheY-like chemotaxis protein